MIYGIDSNKVRADDLREFLSKYKVALLGEYESADILLINNAGEYQNHGFNHNKNKCSYKDVIFYDYVESLKNVDNIILLSKLSDFKLSEEPTALRIKINKDSFLDKKIEENSKATYYSEYIMPLINSVKSRQDNNKKKVIQAILKDIKNVLLKNNGNFCIMMYADIIQKKKIDAFIGWLKTDEAKEISMALLNSSNGNYASFELKYLILMGQEKEKKTEKRELEKEIKESLNGNE